MDPFTGRLRASPVAVTAIGWVTDAARSTLSDWDNGVSDRAEAVTGLLKELMEAADSLDSAVDLPLVRRICEAAGVAAAVACTPAHYTFGDVCDDGWLWEPPEIMVEYLEAVVTVGGVANVATPAQWQASLQHDLRAAGAGKPPDDCWDGTAVDLVVCAARAVALHLGSA